MMFLRFSEFALNASVFAIGAIAFSAIDPDRVIEVVYVFFLAFTE